MNVAAAATTIDTDDAIKISNIILSAIQKESNRIINVTDVFSINRMQLPLKHFSRDDVFAQVSVTNVSLVGVQRIRYPSKGPKVISTRVNSGGSLSLEMFFLLPATMITGVVKYNILPHSAANQGYILPFRGIVAKDVTLNCGIVYSYTLTRYTLTHLDVVDETINFINADKTGADERGINVHTTVNCTLPSSSVQLNQCIQVEEYLNHHLFNYESINGIVTAVKDTLSTIVTSL